MVEEEADTSHIDAHYCPARAKTPRFECVRLFICVTAFFLSFLLSHDVDDLVSLQRNSASKTPDKLSICNEW
jgi:hypothetical protein